MGDWLRLQFLRLMVVPPEPVVPDGSPESVRIFRAGEHYFRLLLVRWGLTQLPLLAGVLALNAVPFTWKFHQLPDLFQLGFRATGVAWARVRGGGWLSVTAARLRHAVVHCDRSQFAHPKRGFVYAGADDDVCEYTGFSRDGGAVAGQFQAGGSGGAERRRWSGSGGGMLRGWMWRRRRGWFWRRLGK